MFYVYLIQSRKNKSLYVGYTNDLKRRLAEHNKGENKATKHKIPLEIIYYESYKARSDAKKREAMLKKHSQAYTALKQRIIRSLT